MASTGKVQLTASAPAFTPSPQVQQQVLAQAQAAAPTATAPAKPAVAAAIATPAPAPAVASPAPSHAPAPATAAAVVAAGSASAAAASAAKSPSPAAPPAKVAVAAASSAPVARSTATPSAATRTATAPAAGGKITQSLSIAGWVGLVIGAKGATVKQLASDFGVQVRVHDETPGKETVVVTGDKAPSVEACIARVKSLIDVARAAGPPGGGTAHARPAFSRAIQLPPGAEAQVIGVAGATVKAICQATSTRVRIIRAVTEGASSTAEVAGESMAAVDAGVRAVLAAANELREAKRAAAAAASAAAAPKPAAGEAAATATGDAPAADAGSSSSAAGGDDDGGDDGDAEGWQTLGGGRRHGGGGGGGGKGAAGPRDRHHAQEGGRAKDAASGAPRGAFGGPGGFVAGGFAAPGGDRGERGAPRLRGAGEAHRGPESRSNALTQRAAAAKFHKTVVMPEPALLAVVVGVRGRTVFRISDEAGVTMVTNRDAGSLTIHGDSMEAISHAEGLVAEVVAHAQAKGRPPPSPEGSSGGPREGRRGRPDNSAAHGPHQH